jgi:hypothetical protein
MPAIGVSSSDSGCVAVEGHVGWNHPSNTAPDEVWFWFRPDLLPELLRYFETIVNRQSASTINRRRGRSPSHRYMIDGTDFTDSD